MADLGLPTPGTVTIKGNIVVTSKTPGVVIKTG
jgi:hypothetical protein